MTSMFDLFQSITKKNMKRWRGCSDQSDAVIGKFHTRGIFRTLLNILDGAFWENS